MTDISISYRALLPVVKPFVLLAYAAFAIFLLWLADGRKIRFFKVPGRLISVLVGAAVTLIAIWFTLHGPLFVISVAMGVAVFAVRDRESRHRALVLKATAVVISAVSLAWWLLPYIQPTGWWHPVAFALTAWCVQAGLQQNAVRPNRPWHFLVQFALFTALGFGLLANTMTFIPGAPVALGNLIHHQGAYIGPALHVRAGLVPFYDIPMQYGLGPTLSIAAVCGVSGCWSGTAFLTVTSTLIMGLLFLRMALTTSVERGPRWRLTVTCVVFAAAFLWTGFPALGNVFLAFPGAGGMRFLPVTLVAFLLFFERPTLAAIAMAPALLWAPEVAVMALAVFGLHETARLGFIKAAVLTGSIAAVSLGGFTLIHHMIYGVWVQPDVVLEYIRHVPAALPINPLSDFIFLVGVLGLAGWNVYRQPLDVFAFRRDLVISALLFACTSYYLGRSHPSNITVLMPFIVLVALRTLDGRSPAGSPELPRLTIIGIAAAVATLTLTYGYYLPFAHGFSIDTAPMIAEFAKLNTDMAAIRSRIPNPDHLGIADIAQWNRNPAETVVWTAADPGVIFGPIPSSRRQLYIKRSAARLRVPGWVILGDAQRDWLDDFRVAYRITEERSYTMQSATTHHPETYLVAHLTPLDEIGQR
jgi:hypothetical protein